LMRREVRGRGANPMPPSPSTVKKYQATLGVSNSLKDRRGGARSQGESSPGALEDPRRGGGEPRSHRHARGCLGGGTPLPGIGRRRPCSTYCTCSSWNPAGCILLPGPDGGGSQRAPCARSLSQDRNSFARRMMLFSLRPLRKLTSVSRDRPGSARLRSCSV
jgi:hypothetical protein